MTNAKWNSPFFDGLQWMRKLLVVAVVLGLASESFSAEAPGDFRKQATWKWPELSSFEQHLLSYMDQLQLSEAKRAEVLQFWLDSKSQDSGPPLLDRLLSAASIVEPRIAQLVKQLRDPAADPVVPSKLDWLTADVPGWLQDTIRLASGRTLAQRRLYDESLEALNGLELNQVCDPASLIFYRAICEHHLLMKKECLGNLKLLLQRDDELPVRYAQVAHLMSADIEPLKVDSLDEVARLMNDVHRRLDLGRAGKFVRDEEKKIVDKLDKLIEDIEQQLKEAQQQRQASSGNQNSPQNLGKPMDDSQIAGGSGPGDVDKKDIGNRSGWGNLPPAERQEALQRLTEELPSHYREVIEGYFRQLAKDRK